MAKIQQLTAQLEEWYVEEGDDRFLKGAKKLPAKLRPLAFAAFGYTKDGKVAEFWSYDDYEERKKAHEQWSAKIGPQLDSISVADRKKIFAIVGKKLAPAIEAAWQYLKSAPYDIGHWRTPFRAPKHPQLTIASRLEWLQSFSGAASDYEADVLTPAWLAAWSAHAFEYRASSSTPILIATMNGKSKAGDEVFDILYKTLTREHPIGIMSRFVTGSLLGSDRPAAWEVVEKTLLAAQRQEGLRQSILESANIAHPEAFQRLLRIIVDKKLIRFSSVARCVDVWLRLLWDSSSTKVLVENVEAVLEFQTSPAKHKKGLASDDAKTVYRALWVTAIKDAKVAAGQAKKLLKHANDEIRYVAAWVLHQLGFDEAIHIKATAISDDNLQVAILASCGLEGLTAEGEVLETFFNHNLETHGDEDCFERIEKLHERLSAKPQTLKSIVWPWTERKIKQSDLCRQLLTTLGSRPPTRMLPYLKGLNSWHKRIVIQRLAGQKEWDKLTRSTLLDLTGNASADVRGAAFEAIEKTKLGDDEYLIFEGYLGRTAVDLRAKVVDLILQRPDKKVLQSVQRLLSADAKKRLGGLEILRQMAEADRSRNECVKAAEQFRTSRKKISKAEQVQLTGIAESDRPEWTLDDGLGLLDPAGRSKIVKPKKKKVVAITSAAIACIKSLDDLVHKHRHESVRYKYWSTWEEGLLGELRYGLPEVKLSKPVSKQLKEFPLWEVWAKWRKDRPAKLRDKDGFELLRAHYAIDIMDDWVYEDIVEFARNSAQKKITKAVLGEFKRPKIRYLRVVQWLLDSLFYTEIPKGCLDFLIDCKENTGANVSDSLHEALVFEDEPEDEDWREMRVLNFWPHALSSFVHRTKTKVTAAQTRRMFELDKFWDEPIPGATRQRVYFESLALAFQKKYATHDDLADALIGPKRGRYAGFGELSSLTDPNPDKETKQLLEKTRGLAKLVDDVRERVLEVELARGEKATVSTSAAFAASYRGIETLFRIHESLNGDYKILSGWNSSPADSRPATLTELIKSTYPLPEEKTADFIKHAKRAIADGYFSEEQLLQLAFLAPQWSKMAGEMLKWDGFSEGLYWFLAHMNTWSTDATSAAATAEGVVDVESDEDGDFDDDDDGEAFEKPEKLSPWERLILERTPLKPAERSEGAVDVDWFHRTFEILGKKRWMAMASSAKLAANSAQAKKAQFLADALLGNTARKTLVEGIKKRNLKENVRLLGLLPLAAGAKQKKDILERYEILLTYKKYARKLSSLTKPEAFRALEIGMSNLARTAGYPDPLRLEWALEAESIKDLAKGPVSITKEGLTVTLELDEDAKPQLSIRRGDKPLKTVPAKLRKKHAAISDLNDRAKELRKKSSRIKRSLEDAMCRGDSIEASELVQLMKHAILAPNLSRIVLIGDGIAGYPDKGGKVLRDHRGKLEPIKKKETLKFAHSADLLKLGDWDKWQRECFQSERVQPFKQVFRELYVPTKKEKTKVTSSRFSGQQIGPKQAMALWGSRGWNTQDQVVKVFHDRAIIANVSFQYDVGTAAEIEGLTVEDVYFQDRDSYKPIKLKDVPPAIFSEVMRDVDLVVSVAHRGEVDPEATESTVEMRSTLVRETCQLLSLKNVKFKPSHVVIKGHYGEYSLHLGSGGIHRLPGGSLAIVPVHAQHRGRLFLPFADNDPKTAEIVSKVLLLAKDEEIMDPSILDQLGAPRNKRLKLTEPEPKKKTKAGKAKKVMEDVGSGKRRLEFSKGKSNKFWEIERSGDSIVTTWGKIGSKGQSKTKKFASEAKAREAFEKLISEKTGKGYTDL